MLAITREPDRRLALDGRGEPVEWAVEMRRFDENKTLDHLADRGDVDAGLADALGRTVAQAHANAPTADPTRWIAALDAYIDEHAEAFDQRPNVFAAEKVERLVRAGRAAYARIHPLLETRGRRGFIRRIHGDLHLGNIVLLDERPVLFDAIEFSDVIGSGDVLYDLAFLLMDLCERNLGVAANMVLNCYLAEAKADNNLDALAALPFFLSMRAAIRAKVTAARLDQAKPDALPDIAQVATKYFDWACRFIAPEPPALIAIGGLSGTGKSLLARALAPAIVPPPGAVVLRSDVERKALFGKNENDPLPPDAYTEDVTARVYASIVAKARRVVAAGHSAIVDAVFAKPDERRQVAQAAASAGAPFTGLFLHADLDTRIRRVGGRKLDPSDANAGVVRVQEAYDLGHLDWPGIDASGAPDKTLKRAKAALR